MMLDLQTMYGIGVGLISGGAAWGGTYQVVKGVKKEQAAVKAALETHTASDTKVQLEMVDRLARIETKLDDLRSAR